MNAKLNYRITQEAESVAHSLADTYMMREVVPLELMTSNGLFGHLTEAGLSDEEQLGALILTRQFIEDAATKESCYEPAYDVLNKCMDALRVRHDAREESANVETIINETKKGEEQ